MIALYLFHIKYYLYGWERTGCFAFMIDDYYYMAFVFLGSLRRDLGISCFTCFAIKVVLKVEHLQLTS